jgi:hypothetical protein
MQAQARMDLTQVLEIASCTDPGMVRSHNEDSIATDPANGLAVLADGMGGYNAGEVASGMATTVIVSEMRQILGAAQPFQIDPRTNQTIAVRLLREQVLKANASIYQAAQSQPQYAGMGTTLVVSLFYDNRVLVAHLGDSRLYLLREGALRQVTRDHSLLQEQIDSGRYEKIIVSQWKAELADDGNFAYAAWGARQVCRDFDEGVALNFLREYHYLAGDAPERDLRPHLDEGVDPAAEEGDVLFPPLDDAAAGELEDIMEEPEEADS